MASLANFVEELQSLNLNVKTKSLNVKASEIIKDPTQYALDFIEASFIQNIPAFLKAYKAGRKFGKDLVDG